MDSAPGILHACQCSVPVIVAAPQEARIAVFPCVILGSLSSLMTFRHWIPLNKGHDHKQVVRLEDFFPHLHRMLQRGLGNGVVPECIDVWQSF